jgi:hypothetical protein
MAELAIPSPRGLDRKLAHQLAGFALMLVALTSVFWVLTRSLALVAVAMAFLLVVGSLYLAGVWGSQRWLYRICKVATQALEVGRVAEARTLLDGNLIRFAANTPMFAVAIWVRARVALREGEFDDACDRLEMLQRWRWYEHGNLLHAHEPQVRAHLVLGLALAGRLDDAELQRGDSSDRGRDWLLTDAVVLARRERFGELLNLLNHRTTLITELAHGDQQCLAFLHAWASFRLARDEPKFRGPHAGLDTPTPLRECGFEFERVEFMTRSWPDLREFILRDRSALAVESLR